MRKVAFEISDNSIQASSSYAGPSVVDLATCVLNREYVITNYMYIIENSLMVS